MLFLVLLACTDAEPVDSGEPVVCVDDAGVEHAVGESWDAGDCGNTYTCEEDGVASRADLGCP